MHSKGKTKINSIILFTFILLAIGTNKTKAQRTTLWNDWNINLGGGALHYYGDISNTSFFEKFESETRYGFHLNIDKKINSWISVGGQTLYGELVGLKEGLQLRNRSEIKEGKTLVFSAKVYEFYLFSKFSINPLFSESLQDYLNVYGKIGIGFSNWASNLNDNLSNEISTSGSSQGGLKALTNETVIPLSVGATYFPHRNIGINLEISFCPVNSDMMDCYESGESGLDYYSYASLGIVIPINKAEKTFFSDYRRGPHKYKHRRTINNRNRR
ncbi:MAG: hypothetical protein ACEPOW_04860 [Bacteroidales bacterium]